MIGTLLNAGGIVLGAAVGLTLSRPISARLQNLFKVALGAFTVFYGIRLTWLSLGGTALHVLWQFGIVLIAMILGKAVGRLLRLQKSSNHLGQFARARIEAMKPGGPDRFVDGFRVCAALFCAAPLGILGAIHDGLSEYYAPLAIKAVMDGLAAMGFAAMFGWGVMLSAVPLLVFQGTLTLLCARFFQPWLLSRGLVEPVNATGGMLIFCVGLLIFEVRKIEVTDYLPSLVMAPLLGWLVRW